MGVEFKSLLIPRDNTFRPSIGQAVDLIAAWTDGGYVLPNASCEIRSQDGLASEIQPLAVSSLAHMQAKDFFLDWEIQGEAAVRLLYPLSQRPEFDDEDISPDDIYWNLRLHFSEDFVEETSEQVGPLDASCVCGENLYYDLEGDIFYSGRIKRLCPQCTDIFRPQDQAVTTVHPFTGEHGELVGGAAYRFAIKINCNRCWSPLETEDGEEEVPRFSDAFVALCSQTLQAPIYEVSYFA